MLNGDDDDEHMDILDDSVLVDHYEAPSHSFRPITKGTIHPAKKKRSHIQKAFARHRFEKDLQDLTHARNNAFLPNALVTFKLRHKSSEYNKSIFEPGPHHFSPTLSNDLHSLICNIEPQNGAYKDGKFCFQMDVPKLYPFKPPIVRAVTQIYHPNVDYHTGEVSLRILQDEWSPVLTLRMVCLALVLLFVEPHLESAINLDCCHTLKNDIKTFHINVRNCMYRASSVSPQEISCKRSVRDNDEANDTELAKAVEIVNINEQTPSSTNESLFNTCKTILNSHKRRKFHSLAVSSSSPSFPANQMPHIDQNAFNDSNSMLIEEDDIGWSKQGNPLIVPNSKNNGSSFTPPPSPYLTSI